MVRYLPNIISTFRLLVAPIALRAMWVGDFRAALVWLFVAGFSDFLDGFLARRLQATSAMGAYLDPIGDKVLLSGTFLVLWLNGAIPGWLVAVVFGRDALMLVAIGATILLTDIRKFPPTWWGKISTAVQIATGLLVLVELANGWPAGHARTTMFVLTLAATGWSAIDYVRIGTRMWQTDDRAN